MLHSFWNTPDPFLRAHCGHTSCWSAQWSSPKMTGKVCPEMFGLQDWPIGSTEGFELLVKVRDSCCQSNLQLKLMRPLNFWEVDVRNTQSHSSLSHPRGLLDWVSFPLCCLSSIYKLHSTLYFSIQKCM